MNFKAAHGGPAALAYILQLETTHHDVVRIMIVHWLLSLVYVTLGLICFTSLIFDRKLRQEVLKVTYFPIQMLRYFMIFGGARVQDPNAVWSFIQIY